jgi:hypothetical protein
MHDFCVCGHRFQASFVGLFPSSSFLYLRILLHNIYIIIYICEIYLYKYASNYVNVNHSFFLLLLLISFFFLFFFFSFLISFSNFQVITRESIRPHIQINYYFLETIVNRFSLFDRKMTITQLLYTNHFSI